MKTFVKQLVALCVVFVLLAGMSTGVMAQNADVSAPQVDYSERTGLITIAQEKMAEFEAEIDKVVVEDESRRGVVTSVELPSEEQTVNDYRNVLAIN